MGLQDLVGATMRYAIKQEDNLFLLTDRGVYKAEPEGDCCANCYIQHISGTDALARGAVVRSVEDIELPPIPDSEKQDDGDDVWGHRITTTKGICSIEMRVTHNGYYGGTLNFGLVSSWPGKPHDDCLEHPELGAACGCLGGALDDF